MSLSPEFPPAPPGSSAISASGFDPDSGNRPEAGTGWELVVIKLDVHSFLQVREFFVLYRMVGRTWRRVLIPGYFEPCNFPSLSCPLPALDEPCKVRAGCCPEVPDHGELHLP